MDTDPNDSVSPDALTEFLDGLEDEVGTDFGTISSRQEKRDAKEKIAREMGVADQYHPNPITAIGQHGDEGRDAHVAVEERYDELRRRGKIQEDPGWEDSLEGWTAEIDRHLEGEGSIYSDVDNEI